MVAYTTAVKNDRLNAVRDAIDAQSGPPKLEIGTAAMATVLATIELAQPSAPGASGGVLTFTMPQSDVSADDTGTAAAARIRDAADTDVITGMTVGTGSEDIVLDSVSITAGQTVTINTATITHAA